VLKKYFPYIILLAAALFLFYIKKHQRGTTPAKPKIDEVIRTDDYPVTNNTKTGEPFNRHADNLIYTKHARCRMDCRHIDESEVKEILEDGKLNYSKIEESDKGKSYPLEGFTHDKQHVRIVFAPKKENLVVVTVIDLDNEWPCNCK
jgi:Domain of unknown function (DUF4258)